MINHPILFAVLFALLGILLSIPINSLADALPNHEKLQPPYCLNCGRAFAIPCWLGLARRHCPHCATAVRPRVWLVEIGTAVTLALLPLFSNNLLNVTINAFYACVLILIIVTDLEHKLIFNVVTYPLTLIALAASFIVSDNSPALAFLGALVGFGFFFLTYWVGYLLFGPGALGMGDVKLAMAMGAMLGFHRILFALILAIFLGGIITALLLLSRRFNLGSYLPYGQYIALGGIIMLIWGVHIVAWYTKPYLK